MAAKGTIGGKIVLDGEKAYREALKNIKADQQELRSEMKLCSSMCIRQQWRTLPKNRTLHLKKYLR